MPYGPPPQGRSTLTLNIDIQHPHPTLAFNIGIQHWHSILAFNIGIQHWHSTLAFNIGIQHWHSTLAFNIGMVQEAEVCSLSIKWRFLELIRRRPAQTGGVPGYGVKHPQADPPHPRAKARMMAVKQTPSSIFSQVRSAAEGLIRTNKPRSVCSIPAAMRSSIAGSKASTCKRPSVSR